MNIKDQVCTLEQAKRLEELGVKQEGAIFYYDEEDGNDLQYNGNDHDIDSPDYGWSAFTVAELGVMLPCGKSTMRVTDDPCDFWHGGGVDGMLIADGYTEAKCRAAMLIHLIENNLITIDEINSRL